MSLRIQQLYDYGKDRPVRFSDVNKGKFEESYTVEYESNNYRVYRYTPPKELASGKYVKDKNHFNGDFSDAPITVFVNKNGDRVINEAYLVHQLHEKYGEGRFQV
jgi:hypothetical protein